MITNAPISAVERTWVPPHSSRETSGISTTRTCSPYFSPNSMVAPSSRACGCVVTKMCSGWFCDDVLVHDRLDPGDLRRRSSARRGGSRTAACRGPTYDPAWATWSPSTSRRAACSRWVAVWLAIVGRRASGVDVRAHALAGMQLAVLEPGDHDLVVVDPDDVLDHRAGRVGLDPAAIGDLAPAASVERRLAQLDQRRAVAAVVDGADLRGHVQPLVADELGAEIGVAARRCPRGRRPPPGRGRAARPSARRSRPRRPSFRARRRSRRSARSGTRRCRAAGTHPRRRSRPPTRPARRRAACRRSRACARSAPPRRRARPPRARGARRAPGAPRPGARPRGRAGG